MFSRKVGLAVLAAVSAMAAHVSVAVAAPYERGSAPSFGQPQQAEPVRQRGCGPGYDWIPELGRCMPDSYRRPERRFTCGRGYDWIPELRRCMPDSYRRPERRFTCGPGFDWHPDLGRCLPDRYKYRRGN